MEIGALEKRFKKVENALCKKSWFKKENWIVSQHPFPKTKPEGITLHVFKKHWFNEEKLGLHFESYLDLDPKKQQKAYITLHLLHYDEVPGLGIARKKLSQPIVDLIYDEVSSWDGYTFRAGKYGLQPFTKILDATKPEFDSELIEEIERLCKQVGPIIDKVLKALKS